MKILFFLPGLNSGGAEKVFINLFNYFKNKNCEIKFLIATNKGSMSPINNLPIERLNSKYALTSFIKYNNFVKNYKPDLILTSLQSAIIVSSLVSIFHFKRKYKLIIRFANIYNKETLVNYIRQKIEKLLISNADGLIFNSEATKNSVNNYLNINIKKFYNKIIYNPVLPDNYLQLRKKYKEKNKIERLSRRYVIIGRLHKQKRIIHAIKAFNNFNIKNDFKLYIVGDGPEKKSLKIYLHKNNIKNVYFISYCKNIFYLLANSKCLINTSLFEGFGNIFIEGLAFCENLIAYKSHGSSFELLNDTNAILIENSNLNSLTSKLKIISKNTFYNKLDKNKLDQFTYSNIGLKYEQYFVKLLNK